MSLRLIERDPNFRWCSNDACPHGQVQDNGLNEPTIICQRPGCGQRTCFLHHTPWHNGLTCREYQRQTDPQFRANDVTDAEKDRNPDLYGKRCPKNCGRRIYKHAGCSHMICVFCPSIYLMEFFPIAIWKILSYCFSSSQRRQNTCIIQGIASIGLLI